MSSSSECPVCDGKLEDGPSVLVKEKGVERLLQASIERKDGRARFFRGETSVKGHTKCSKKYIHPHYIASYLKKGPERERPSTSSSLPTTRAAVPQFKFKTHCLLCAEIITKEYIEAQKKVSSAERNVVYPVRSHSTKGKVLLQAEKRGDEWGKAIIQRIQAVEELPPLDAQYHSHCLKKLYQRPAAKEKKKSGQFASDIEKAMENIYSYLEASEESQFSMAELLETVEGDYKPDLRTVKSHLIKKYGEDIIITTNQKQTPVVCFKRTGYKIVTDAWYRQRNACEQEERLRIVKAAAEIMAEDIRSKVFETDEYPPTDNFLEKLDLVVPETLRVLTETLIIKNKKGNLEAWKKKCTALAHSIMSAVRPRSFISPLQVGLAAFLYKKFGSKKLIDVLSALGFCSSYTEAVRFEVSSIMTSPIQIEEEEAFSQFVFDNADFNTHTLDGYHTFHAMGGIHCIHPKTAVLPQESIKRVMTVPSAQTVGSFGVVKLQHFDKKSATGLKAITVRNLDDMLSPSSTDIVPTPSDLLWMYGKWADIPGMPGWSTFMVQVTKNLPYQQTSVVFLPFINAPPNDYDTVYTVLMSSAEKCKLLNQQTCFVTFDQPLYLKARNIVSCHDPNLKNVIPRLGGFHLLMSFFGAIGYIMGGSGLKELFNTIYAMNSIDMIMSGHAYARAVRGHILAHSAIASLIMDKLTLTPAQRSGLEETLIDPERSVVLSASEEIFSKELMDSFMSQVRRLKDSGPTGKLWIQYFEMVTLAKQFIEAERMGNWKLHLDTIAKMLPFFHASGHFSYAKCGHLYLQDMHDLEKTMDAGEFMKLTTDGTFTIRRTDKFWCGTWSDMTIEQTLMKSMKTIGGLTHGRGVSESILARWTMGMTALQHVCDGIEKFCSISFASSEQHMSVSDTRVKRDNQDCNKMKQWLEQHEPFPSNSCLMSISTGLVGDSRINCHMSQEVGTLGIRRIEGQNFETVKFKRNDRVQPLAVMSSGIKIEGETVPINPTMLFQRISIAKRTDQELEDFLTYELCPFPLSIFNEVGMRKTTKSALYKAFQPCEREAIPEDSVYVIDGGHLLHRVPWPRGATFSVICDSYITFVCSKFRSTAVTVFDGYPENEASGGTKFAERARRAQKHVSSEILSDETMTPTVPQENFLANPKNKTRLIDMIMTKFAEAGMGTKKATEDADCLIVTTAFNLAPNHASVVVVGDDVDLLVILIGNCRCQNVYFLKPGKGKVEEKIFWPPSALDSSMSKHILPVHAISGCDTTSALFNQGKMKVFNTLKRNLSLQNVSQTFLDPHATPEAIGAAGKHFLVALYGGPAAAQLTLNKLRYKAYIKSSFNRVSNLASLPPTEAAAEQHSYRAYHQVQHWLGWEKRPEDWGWERTKRGLQPVKTTLPPAPTSILNKISCRCKMDCKRNCGCRKAGLHCTLLCLGCGGNSCDNRKVVMDEEEEDEEEDDPPQWR